MKRIFFLFIFCFSVSLSQKIDVKSEVDTKKIVIGDWIKLDLKATHSNDIKIIWPKIEDVIGKFELIRKDSIPKISTAKDENIETLTAIISIYDSGYYQVPAIPFKYTINNDTSIKVAYTEPIDILVNTIAVDTTLPIKDIKDVMDVPIPFLEIISYIALVILIILLIYAYYKNYKLKKSLSSIVEQIPLLPPHEQAYKELNELEKKKLWQKGFVKEYYTEVTEIIRRYIERRYSINAMEMTSTEILNSLLNVHRDKKLLEILESFLNLADYVKFAKFQPNTIENEEEIKKAYTFIDNTKLVETEVENNIEKEEKSVE